MASRLKLHDEFCKVARNTNVYFNPPEGFRMKYPAIRYSLSGGVSVRANNRLYRNTDQYSAIVIDEDPDSTIFRDILEHFPMSSLGTPYVANGLNHWPITIYY